MSIAERVFDSLPELEKPKKNQNDEPLPKFKRLNQIERKPIEWVIPDWVPVGGITLLVSDGGCGKTYLAVSLLSALSNGRNTILADQTENETAEPKDVLFWSTEDNESILLERFEQAGGNPEHVAVIGLDTNEEDCYFDSKGFEEVIATIKPCLLVIDPLQGFLPPNIDMSRRNHMRTALKRVSFLASQYHMGIIILMHTNKRENAVGRDKVSDSSDIWDLSRSVLMMGYAADDKRYVSLEKASYTDHMSVPSVLFSIENGKVKYEEVTEKKMKDFPKPKPNQSESESSGKITLKEQCMEEIISFLHRNGKTKADQLTEELKFKKFSDKTIRTAKTELKRRNKISFDRKDGIPTYEIPANKSE